jgi:hypothetical protein
MSMFDRNVKIQINKMKYADLVSKNPKLPFNYQMNPLKIFHARILMLVLGVGCAISLFHYDIFWYKTTRGLARWKKRLLSWLPQDDHHGHQTGSHSSSHDKHDTNSHSTTHDHNNSSHNEHKEEHH